MTRVSNLIGILSQSRTNPTNPQIGDEYWNTVQNTWMRWDGVNWWGIAMLVTSSTSTTTTTTSTSSSTTTTTSTSSSTTTTTTSTTTTTTSTSTSTTTTV